VLTAGAACGVWHLGCVNAPFRDRALVEQVGGQRSLHANFLVLTLISAGEGTN